MKKAFLIICGLALIVIIGLVVNQKIFLERQQNVKEIKPLVIGFSQGVETEERWATDAKYFKARAEELGAQVKHVISDDDVDKQMAQIQGLINEGVKVIVVVPSDSEKLAPVIARAHEVGVKIIAYDRLLKNSDLDYYISFDNIVVGQLQAESILSKVDSGKFAYIGGSPTDNNAFLVKEGSMSVLKPKISRGEISLVIDEFMDGWEPEEAYRTVKNYLSSGKKLDAVVVANDGMASAVVRALSEYGLAGKIPVSGQDADLAACQRIIAGTQTATVYKPIKALAGKAAEMAFVLSNGRNAETNSLVSDGEKDIPSYLISPIIVNKDNMMHTVIKDGFHLEKDVYGETD